MRLRFCMLESGGHADDGKKPKIHLFFFESQGFECPRKIEEKKKSCRKM